jgi:hypothetical protein
MLTLRFRCALLHDSKHIIELLVIVRAYLVQLHRKCRYRVRMTLLHIGRSHIILYYALLYFQIGHCAMNTFWSDNSTYQSGCAMVATKIERGCGWSLSFACLLAGLRAPPRLVACLACWCDDWCCGFLFRHCTSVFACVCLALLIHTQFRSYVFWVSQRAAPVSQCCIPIVYYV